MISNITVRLNIQIKAIFLIFLLFLHPPCAWPFGEKSEQKRNKHNLIIICLDTLRADHLGCYGYSRKTSLNIDRLAKDGILFEWAIAQSSFTLPSIASLFTSKYVSTHKLDCTEKRLGKNEITLAQVLRNNGYKTAAFIYNAAQFMPVYGLNMGFEIYDFGEEEPNREPSFIKTMPKALNWIENNKDKKFFVFLHSNDVHEPYHSIYENFFDPNYKGRLNQEYFGSKNLDFRENSKLTRTPREINHIISHYDGGIKYADSFIPELIKKLEELKLKDKTIIILLSDHGEILADRGIRFLHGFSVHDEEVRVPLIIMHPGIELKGLRIKSQVQLIDVMPTVLDFLGVNTRPLDMEGKSLIPLIEGGGEDNFEKYAYSECIKGESEVRGVSHEMMVRSPSWKIIASVWKIDNSGKKNVSSKVRLDNGAIVLLPKEFNTNYELYNLRKDPKELTNLVDSKDEEVIKAKVEMLERLLERF